MGQHYSTNVAFPSFNVEMTAPEITRALEYVSDKMRKRNIHVHLIIAGRALSCLLLKLRPTTHDISILQASPLSPRSLSILVQAVQKAGKKFGLGVNWVNTQLENEMDHHYLDNLIHQSLLQNEIIFSSEGLSLYAVDLFFALKSKLARISTHSTPQSRDLDEAVELLRRLVVVYRGRPLPKGYIKRHYPRIEVTDQALLRLNSEYEWRFGSRGICGVNDEYMVWRREGAADWKIGFEELKREVSLNVRDSPDPWDEKPFPEAPHETIAAIFATKGVY
ncbi:hypothetical protein RUND412_008772 [Rhizina undulata]